MPEIEQEININRKQHANKFNYINCNFTIYCSATSMYAVLLWICNDLNGEGCTYVYFFLSFLFLSKSNSSMRRWVKIRTLPVNRMRAQSK